MMKRPYRTLVERVHSCIVGEPECGHMQARAAIREVAAWLRDSEGDYSTIRQLEMQADTNTSQEDYDA